MSVKKAPAKKATVKKTATKAVATEKKVAPKKATIKKAIENQEAQDNVSIEEKGKQAAAATIKVMDDTEKICEAINILKTVNHDKVGARIQNVVNELDDMSYICATGRPRIDNLKSKQSALQLNSKILDSVVK